MSSNPDIAIIGAGIAGLVAARELTAAGASVVVLEARHGAGGRVRTVPGRPPLELGPEFLPPDGPAATALRRLGSPLALVPDTHGRVAGGAWEPLSFNGAVAALERAGERVAASGGDRSLTDALAETGADPSDAALAARYVEQYHAAPAATVSAAWVARMEGTEEGGGGGAEVRAAAGLDALPRHLAGSLPAGALRTRARVSTIQRVADGVRIAFRGVAGDDALVARRALVTLAPPLAARVLATAGLPDAHRTALGRLRMGNVVKVGLRFRDGASLPLPAGPSADPPSFLHADAGPFPAFWVVPGSPGAVIAWAGGSAADALRAVGRRDLVRLAVAQLAGMAGLRASNAGNRLVGAAVRHWARDRHTRGAYAHAIVGGAGAADTLAEPIDGVIFLAGEAISEAMGTVDGAWNSALRAVAQITGAPSRAD